MLNYILSKLNTALDWYLLLAIVFIPLCLFISNGPHRVYHSGNSHSIHCDDSPCSCDIESMEYKYTLVVVLTFSCVYLFEIVSDNLSDLQTILSLKGSLNNLALLITLIISTSINFFISIPSHDFPLIYRIFQIRNIVMFSTIFSYVYRYGKSIWRDRILILAACMGGVGCVLKIESLIQSDTNVKFSNSLKFIGGSLQACLCVIILIYLTRWLIFIRRESFSRPITDDEWHTSVYLTIGIITVFTASTCNLIYGGDVSASNLVFMEIIFAISAFIQALYRTRCIRQESNKRKEALEFKRMFVRYISHEVRTPLNTAIMGLQLLLDELKGIHPDILDILNDVKKSCDIAVSTLNELLTFDKLEAGTLMLEKTKLNAFKFIEDNVNFFQIQAKKSRINLTLQLAHQFDYKVRLAKLKADKNKLSQVMRNLISNGLKFTPEGGEVNIFVDLIHAITPNGQDSYMLKLDVVDSGAGISTDNQKKLFKEIVQFNPGKLQNGGGSGLGLFISYGIVDLHGGNLSVYSKGEGSGSTFTMTLPCYYTDIDNDLDLVETSTIRKGSGVPGIYAAPTRVSPTSAIDVEDTNKSNSKKSVKHKNLRKSKELQVFDIDDDHCLVNTTSSISDRGINKSVKIDSINNKNKSNYNNNSNHKSFIRDDNDEKNDNDGNNNIHIKGVHSEVKSSKESKESEAIGCQLLHMLVVDDSAISRKMQCRLLKKRCASCVEAENGQEAVDKVKMAMARKDDDDDGIDPIDLIIMDCNMPVINGMEATKIMRNMGYRGIIIGVTGNVCVEDIENFISHGADVVLAKPFDIEKFDIALNNLLCATK